MGHHLDLGPLVLAQAHEQRDGGVFELHKSIEKPSRYRLLAKWETLENHTVDFRGSPDFAEWRALVGAYFLAPPEVEHTETVVTTAGYDTGLSASSQVRVTP